MNKILILLLLLICNITSGQNSSITSKQLDEKEINSIFTDSIKKILQLDYSIYRVYSYKNKVGKNFIVMTENNIEFKAQKKCSDSIKTYCYSYKNDAFNLKWSIKDFILPNTNEYSISHWTKYFKIEDYDKDDIVDPIIIYGTYGMNEMSDGRIKILVYYKGKKRTITHQNSVHDRERHTQVDKQFYTLPIEIQNRVKTIMKNIEKNNHGIFPYDWQKAMENKKPTFDEN